MLSCLSLLTSFILSLNLSNNSDASYFQQQLFITGNAHLLTYEFNFASAYSSGNNETLHHVSLHLSLKPSSRVQFSSITTRYFISYSKSFSLISSIKLIRLLNVHSEYLSVSNQCLSSSNNVYSLSSLIQ